jgi:nickel-dependent lactate racemase
MAFGANKGEATMPKYSFLSNIWYGGEAVTVDLPDDWMVEVCHMKGHERPVLSDAMIQAKIDQPVGCGCIRDEARGSESAVIMFDDLTRPTQTYRIVHFVLEELKEAGVPHSAIHFMMAQGLHRAYTRYDYVKKLGEDIVNEYPVFSHNPFINCVRLGVTSYGTPVEINADVMDADYKVGIGSLVPHGMIGFGGGGKMIVPGVASLETIRRNHYLSVSPQGKLQPGAGCGNYDHNEHRLDVEEATRMAGLNFKIDTIINYKGEICNIYAGDPIEEHHMGVKEAREHYLTQQATSMDVVIANAHCKANEPQAAINSKTIGSLKENGGVFINVTNIPEGIAPHYLYGRWGLSRVGGWSWREKKPFPDRIKQFMVFSKYIDKGGNWCLGSENKIEWINVWDLVCQKVGGGRKKVAIYPDATIQLVL